MEIKFIEKCDAEILRILLVVLSQARKILFFIVNVSKVEFIIDKN